MGRGGEGTWEQQAEIERFSFLVGGGVWLGGGGGDGGGGGGGG